MRGLKNIYLEVADIEIDDWTVEFPEVRPPPRIPEYSVLWDDMLLSTSSFIMKEFLLIALEMESK